MIPQIRLRQRRRKRRIDVASRFGFSMTPGPIRAGAGALLTCHPLRRADASSAPIADFSNPSLDIRRRTGHPLARASLCLSRARARAAAPRSLRTLDRSPR